MFQTLRVERLTTDYLHLNQAPIRLNGYPLGTADLPNTADFVSSTSLTQPDWLTVNTDSLSFIRNKPLLSKVALTGAYADLSGAPDDVPVNADWNVQDATQLSFVRNKPSISAVGSSGRYSDLLQGSGQPVVPTSVDYNATSSSATTLAIVNRPNIPAGQVQSDWGVTTASSLAYIRNKPGLSAVALSGSFGDLLNRPVVYQSVDWTLASSTGTTLAIANRPSIPPAPVNADWAASTGAAAILNKPLVPPPQVNADWAATTGPAAILSKPNIPPSQINSDWGATAGSVAYIANKPNLGKTATTNNYGDLSNLPTITPQQQSDWAATSGVTAVQNKPLYAAVALSGKYSDLLANSGQPTLPNAVDWSLSASTSTTLAIRNRPTIPAAQVQSDWGQTDNTQISYINNRPTLATVATSGSYNDLSNKPATSSGVAQSDWTQTDSTQASYINHKPSLATVSATGKYSDLVANSGQPSSVTAASWTATTASGGVIPVTNKPTIPAAQVNSDWNSTSGVSQIVNLPTFGAAAYSNSYSDLTGKPTIIAPVNADWNSTSGLSQILNRPALGPVATSNKYGDLTNLPTIPTQADYSLSSSSGTSLAVVNKPTALSAFTNDVGYYKPNDSPTFGILSTTLVYSSGAINLNSTYSIALASDLSSSTAALAGTLTYNPPGGACTPASSSSGSVDLYGAGTSTGSRLLNLWDLVTVQGTFTVSGSTSLQAVTATSLSSSGAVSTGALTAASLSTGGNATITGTLGVSGASTLQAATVTTLTASAAVSTGALTASSVSTGGNLTVTGTAAIAGATSTHALTATSMSTSGTLGVSGTSTLAALSATSVANSGNETIGGTLGVTGASTFAGVTATSVTNSGNETIAGTLGVTGATVLAGVTANSVTNKGNETIAGTLGVTGASTFTGLATASAGMNVPGANILNFGSDQTKETSAGKIGYQTFDVGYLNIVGAGTSSGSRGIKLYDNVVVSSALSAGSYTGLLSTSGNQFSWNGTSNGGNTSITSTTRGYSANNASLLYNPAQIVFYDCYNTGNPGVGAMGFQINTQACTGTTSYSEVLRINNGNVTISGTASVTGAATLSAGVTQTGLTSWPTTGTSSGMTWGSGPFSKIVDDGDLRVCTDDNMHFYCGLTGSSNGTEVLTLTTGAVTSRVPVNVLGSNVINLGADQTKQTDAGKIGYGTFTPNALDIIGGGTSTPRTIKLWDNVTIPGTLMVTGGITAAPAVNSFSSNTTSMTFATPYGITICYGRTYLYGNGGQGSASAFNLRLACSSNGGSSYDTGGYTVTMSQSNAGAVTAISQSGYPTIASGIEGYLNTCGFQIQVYKGLGDTGQGQAYGHVLDVTVNGILSNGSAFRNTGTIFYSPGGDSNISNVRITLEGQSNGLGGPMSLGVMQVYI